MFFGEPDLSVCLIVFYRGCPHSSVLCVADLREAL